MSKSYINLGSKRVAFASDFRKGFRLAGKAISDADIKNWLKLKKKNVKDVFDFNNFIICLCYSFYDNDTEKEKYDYKNENISEKKADEKVQFLKNRIS